MAITRSQIARQLLAEGGVSLDDAKMMAPEGEFLAYINSKEAKMLKQAGGSVEIEEEEQRKKEIVDSTLSGNKSVVIPESVTNKKIKESMLFLNPRNSLFVS